MQARSANRPAAPTLARRQARRRRTRPNTARPVRPGSCRAPEGGRLCVGCVCARAEWVVNPLPLQLAALLAQHGYSPPDLKSNQLQP